ncbi:hypothetical protein CKO25_20565 [Thiocapsa imhoffii]|uniref:Glycosyl transferase family 1 domain-containing protein n=1 Tax=Thiocapsa imhoffii TaxID=382777 RepID=A0A9X0WMQ6_9GAMM|nr:glycosyltransferase [Thiocapsa imhoffii]MBK1646965.1 hypothetical protein [Thiocapsa imhoffii]
MKLIIVLDNVVTLEGRTVWAEPGLDLLFGPLLRAEIDLSFAVRLTKEKGQRVLAAYNSECVRTLNMGFVYLGDSSFKKILNYIRFFKHMWGCVGTNDFIYIFFPGALGFISAAICLLRMKPYGLYIRKDSKTGRSWEELIKVLQISRAQFVICTGDYLVKQSKKLNSRVSAVIPMTGILEKHTEAKSQLNDNFVSILFVGRLIRDKGIFEILRAVYHLSKIEHLNVRLRYVGDGSDRQLLETEICSLSLDTVVRCYGSITDVQFMEELYRQSDIFCLPTYHSEGVPRVFYEAMQFGIPILTTRMAQWTGLLVHKKSAFLCEPKSVACLIESLRLLITERESRDALARGGASVLEGLKLKWSEKNHGDQVLGYLGEQEMLELKRT